jgi:crotonobetainyl-CoA:carnitine CoA-transferase CaiB-like acyl-CoA transferase
MSQMALEGITIADFGQAWAGPHFSRTLADMGALVIKIESQRRMDAVRDCPHGPRAQSLVRTTGVLQLAEPQQTGRHHRPEPSQRAGAGHGDHQEMRSAGGKLLPGRHG